MSYITRQQWFRIESFRRALTVGLGAQLLVVPALVAQDNVVTTTAPDEVKKVVITGSLIPTAETVGVAPVNIYTSETISQSGAQDVLSALKSLTPYFAGNGNVGQTVNNGGNGEANIALRNLSTLVLLDGHRLANSAFSQGSAVDVNTLPVAMIERIEVLKDGASTVYGADAVGGVVNVITKKNYNGFELSGRYGFSTENPSVEEYRASIVGGSSTEKTSITMGADYYHMDPLFSRDRFQASAGIQDLDALGIFPPSYISPSYPGRVDNFILAGSPFAIGHPGYNPNVTVPPVIPGQTFHSVADYNTAAQAKFGYSPYIDLGETPQGQAVGSPFSLLNTPNLGTISIQQQDRYSAFANFNHQIFDNHLELFGQFLYTHTASEAQLAPSPVSSLGSSAITVPADNPYNPFGIDLGAAGAISPRVRSRFLGFGNRTFVSDTDYYHFVGGLKGDISEDYHWNSSYNFNRSDQTQYTRNAINGGALNLALQPDFDADPSGSLSKLIDFNGNPVPTFNIFGVNPGGQADPVTVDNLRATLFQHGTSDLWTWDASVNGTPFDLPAGKFAFAVGGGYSAEQLTIEYDGLTKAGLVPGLNPAAPFPGGTRERWAGYVEVNIPVFSADNNIPVFHAFEISASGRYEHLDPGGETEVPKVGFRWQPLDEQITIRGTYSQGFQVPTLFTLYGPTQVSFNDFTIQGENAQGELLFPSNPNIPPATSENFNIGVVLTPKCVKNLTISADYYHITQDGIPYNPAASDEIDDINALGAASIYAPGLRLDGGRKITSNAPNQVTPENFESLVIPLLPGAAQRTDGIDLSATYVLLTDSVGKFTFRTDANVLFNYDARQAPGTPFYPYAGFYTDQAGSIPLAQGTLPDYIIVPSLTWEFHNFTYYISARYIPSVTDPGDLHPSVGGSEHGSTINGLAWEVPSYYTIDMRLSYNFRSESGKKWYDGTMVAVGCNNVTDNTAPIIASAFEDNTDKSTYDLLGRFLYFEISKKF